MQQTRNINNGSNIVRVSTRVKPQGAYHTYDCMGTQGRAVDEAKPVKCLNSAQWRAACTARGYNITYAPDVKVHIALDVHGSPVGAMRVSFKGGVEQAEGWIV